MDTTSVRLSWRLGSPTALFTLLLGGFMLYLSVGGLLNPVEVARGFGLPLTGTEAIAWMSVKAGRDFGIALALFGLVAARQRKAAGIFVVASVVMPVTDALTVMGQGVSFAYAFAVHGSAAIYGICLGWALLRPGKARG
ncbi:DUF4267 domain-containing protein [Myxococcus sp. AB025B]|uniref:DUF4267 domain-containing protein n=1 Tax=Myxococcus sp. AB025B TaxID=2562794 RepID=UPI001144D687|nr:DUF4267 domain-containing protein [Myxococcus sp. AB025B]